MRLLKILAIGRPLLDARFVLQCVLGSLILISEIGMSAWRNEKSFVSWLELSPPSDPVTVFIPRTKALLHAGDFSTVSSLNRSSAFG